MKKSEAEVQKNVRLEAIKKGARLWRNNVGALHTKRGDFVRYGLANESGKMNNQIKSADLIGIKPVIITMEMVGKTIGQFISREIKKSDWQFGKEKSKHNDEMAQLAWIKLINSLGGDASFATEEGTIN
jgi:hypothetical protein